MTLGFTSGGGFEVEVVEVVAEVGGWVGLRSSNSGRR